MRTHRCFLPSRDIILIRTYIGTYSCRHRWGCGGRKGVWVPDAVLCRSIRRVLGSIPPSAACSSNKHCGRPAAVYAALPWLAVGSGDSPYITAIRRAASTVLYSSLGEYMCELAC
jgi:hypothetical protein